MNKALFAAIFTLQGSVAQKKVISQQGQDAKPLVPRHALVVALDAYQHEDKVTDLAKLAQDAELFFVETSPDAPFLLQHKQTSHKESNFADSQVARRKALVIGTPDRADRQAATNKVPQMEKKRRSACDRCHSQKLRCLRERGEETCNRCHKNGERCVFSVSMRGFRSRTVKAMREAELQSQTEAGKLDLGVLSSLEEGDFAVFATRPEQDTIDTSLLEWIDISLQPSQAFNYDISNFQNEDIPDIGLQSNIQQEAPRHSHCLNANQASNSISQTEFIYQQVSEPSPKERSLTSSARQKAVSRDMADLLGGLNDHLEGIPPLSIHSQTSTAPASDIASYWTSTGPAAENGKGTVIGSFVAHGFVFPLDQTFHLTETLVNLYPRFMDAFIRDEQSQSSYFSTSMNSMDHLQSGSLRTHNSWPNHSSIFHMLSCHHRVIDIWDLIFQHIPLCISQNSFKPGEQPYPPLKIGEFQSSPQAAIPMEFMMCFSFITQLYDEVQDLVDEISPKPITPNDCHVIVGEERVAVIGKDVFGAIAMACRALMARADALVKTGRSTRKLMVQHSSQR